MNICCCCCSLNHGFPVFTVVDANLYPTILCISASLLWLIKPWGHRTSLCFSGHLWHLLYPTTCSMTMCNRFEIISNRFIHIYIRTYIACSALKSRPFHLKSYDILLNGPHMMPAAQVGLMLSILALVYILPWINSTLRDLSRCRKFKHGG
jgi:hypothetical protein